MRSADDQGPTRGRDADPTTTQPVQIWVVRADSGKYTDDFIAGGYVAIGWFDLSSVGSREEIRRRYEREYPDALAGQIGNETGQLAGFRLEMAEGDYVITPAADRESLRYGRITGPCVGVPGDGVRDHRNRRSVAWTGTPLRRSALAESLQSTLGSPRTVFRVQQRDEFLAAIGGPDESLNEAVGRGGTSRPQASVSPPRDVDAGIEPDPATDPSRPLPGTQTGQVWDLADEITREKGRCAERGEVVERFAARGGNRNTASTTYYRWKEHHDARSAPLESDRRREAGPKAVDAPARDTAPGIGDAGGNGHPAREDDDVEPDSGVDEERDDPELPVEHPFDPSKIKVRTIPILVDQLVERIRHREIDLAPDFQRMRGIWKPVNKSRLIESLLLRIPIPVFYVAADADDNWEVVDGVQRMSTMCDYVSGEFPLTGLEYRVEFNGRRFEQLPRVMQRRIRETQLVVNVIEPGTPPEVMFNIFSRINTGGMKLNAQEIRHALHPGPVRDFLKTLAGSEAFLAATNRSIKPDRMIDRECVLRFLAFHIEQWEQYRSRSLDGYLAGIMKRINAMTPGERNSLAADFEKAMRAAQRIFGGKAFRNVSNERARINKSLFEAWGVQLARCSPHDIERLAGQRGKVLTRFKAVLRDPEFDKAISQATAMPQRIRKRFTAVRDLVQEFV
ncbi:MAG: DUF262 domain-containing protein [Acidobacteria bacterium]|nr:DUF262 domain-containing protein [Acidobacteriota bacterium]